MSLDFSLMCQCCHSEIFSYNITHNLNNMAAECGLYEVLWHSENKIAKEIIPTLEKGYNKLLANSNIYSKFNPSNGWGNYDNLLEFAKVTLEACKKYPEATIHISR